MAYEELLLVFLGGVGMMTLYVGLQAVMTGQRVYRYYALYSLCWIAYFFFKVLYRFSDPRLETFVDSFGRIGFAMLAYVFYYRFADAFLDLRRTLPSVFNLFRQTQRVLLLYVALEFMVCLFLNEWTTTPAHEWVHALVRLGLSVVSVYGMIKAWGQRNTLVNYFVTGSALLLLFGLVAMILSLMMTEETHRSWIRDNPIAFLNIGITLELLCFSLGLSYKNKQTELQKITIEQEITREREQRELAQLKTHFFTNISHEFRTPLTLILGPLTELVQKNPAQATYQLMHRNASRLLTLVNQLLDLSKLDAGQLTPFIQAGNLTEWLQVVVGSFSSLADSRDNTLSFVDVAKLTEMAYFDRDKTEKIVTNLLSNALKFTSAGGTVSVRLDVSAQREAIIQVQDTGIGIPAAQQERIFERFHQLIDHQSNQAEGTGIGLALVRELVMVLKGRITLDSQPGHGTTITVTLPIDKQFWAIDANEEPSVEDIPEQDRQLATVSSKQSVTSFRMATIGPATPDRPVLLVIDDNADIRQYIRQVLEDDFQVIEATNGRSGLTQATTALPDLIICDWMMPSLDGTGLDGMAFCKSLKTQPTTDHIPVIMLTAKATTENRIDGFAHGADDYLIKPFHPGELRARVKNLLTQRQKLRDRFSRELYLKPATISIPSVEEVFLQQAIAQVERHLDTSAFTVEQLADALHLSRMQLHRKLKALTGRSATEFVRHVRLQRAAGLLASRSATVSEVAYRVGFESLSYFSKSFKEEFGVLPSEYEGVTLPVTS